MIVRVSGEGQYELDEAEAKQLDQRDTSLVAAINAGDMERFRSELAETIRFVEENGTPVPHDRVVPSEVIIPPRDIDLDEARQFFTDEGLMKPLPA
jgi:hypothetical protein